MTPHEKRRQERLRLAEPRPDCFMLIAPEGTLPVRGVQDISNAGINLRLDRAVPPAQRVTVRYTDTKVQLNAYGIVAWCSPEAGGFVAGIELFSPTLLIAAMDTAQGGPRG